MQWRKKSKQENKRKIRNEIKTFLKNGKNKDGKRKRIKMEKGKIFIVIVKTKQDKKKKKKICSLD